MSVRWNLAAGFAHSVWGAAVSILAVPFYLYFLGVEAYGLIGFYTAMQALFVLLDMGLGPTIVREVAQAQAKGEIAAARNLLRTLAIIYWALALLVGMVVVLLAPLIAGAWLNNASLPNETVARAVALMGVVIAIRFPISLYTGALVGAHRLGISSMIGILGLSVANLGVIPVLAWWSASIETFFIWQAIAALIHLAVLHSAAWRVLKAPQRPRFDMDALRRVWRFSAGMGAATVLGTIFMQADKVVLSSMVSLEDFGKYTLAWVIARTLYLFMTPTFSVVYPRLTSLMTEGRGADALTLYKSGTRLMMAAVFPLAAFLAIFSEEVFLVWTGGTNLGEDTLLVVAFLLLGTALNGAMHFPYAAQLAAGKSHLPMIINLILLILFVPMLFLLTRSFGVVGAAAAWAGLNALYVALGTWLTHRTIFPGAGARWLATDVGVPLLTSLAVVVIAGLAVRQADWSPLPTLIAGAGLALLAFLATVAVSPHLVHAARRFLPGREASASPQLNGEQL